MCELLPQVQTIRINVIDADDLPLLKHLFIIQQRDRVAASELAAILNRNELVALHCRPRQPRRILLQIDRGSPVGHKDFTEPTKHRVFGLQVAMDHAFRVSKSDRIGNLHENLKVLLASLFAYGRVPSGALHQLHRIEQHAALVRTQFVDRYDVRVIQVGCNLGFVQESTTCLFILLKTRLGHLERNDSVDRCLPS